MNQHGCTIRHALSLVTIAALLAFSGACKGKQSASEADEQAQADEARPGTIPSSCPSGTSPKESYMGTLATWACHRADGTRHGPVTSSYPDGRIAMVGRYRDGLKSGRWVWYDRGRTEPSEPGDPAEADQPAPKIREGEYDSKGRETGVWTEWTPEGTLISQVQYAEGKTQGLAETWWPNGTKRSSTTYVKGKEQGPSVSYHEDGQKNAEGSYHDGKRAGRWTSWHKNGEKWWEGEYDQDKQTGSWTWWNESGELSRSCEFQNGEQVSCQP